MTKAERIFRDTLATCRQDARRSGRQYNPDGRPIGYNGVITRDDESYSTRTLNAIEPLIRSERSSIRLSEKLGVLTGEELELNKYALDMVQVTVENSRKRLAELEVMIST